MSGRRRFSVRRGKYLAACKQRGSRQARWPQSSGTWGGAGNGGEGVGGGAAGNSSGGDEPEYLLAARAGPRAAARSEGKAEAFLQKCRVLGRPLMKRVPLSP